MLRRFNQLSVNCITFIHKDFPLDKFANLTKNLIQQPVNRVNISRLFKWQIGKDKLPQFQAWYSMINVISHVIIFYVGIHNAWWPRLKEKRWYFHLEFYYTWMILTKCSFFMLWYIEVFWLHPSHIWLIMDPSSPNICYIENWLLSSMHPKMNKEAPTMKHYSKLKS